MSFATEINIQREKGDTYAFTIDTTSDYSTYTVVLITEHGNISPSIMTSSSITFPGTLVGTFDEGLHNYKVTATLGAIQKTIIKGVFQILDDNLVITP